MSERMVHDPAVEVVAVGEKANADQTSVPIARIPFTHHHVRVDPCSQRFCGNLPARIFLTGGVPALLRFRRVNTLDSNPLYVERQRIRFHYARVPSDVL